MSELFTYICTRQTADPYIPPGTTDLRTLARDVADGFTALVGGYLTVGQLAFFPQQRAIPNHLLCDGKEVPKYAFPELYEFLGDFEGTPVDPANFVLPNYIGGALTPAAVAAPETVIAGTVTSETPSDPGTGSGGSVDYAVPSGGREPRGAENYE